MIGGGGPLGSAVLSRLLGGGAWARVAVLVNQAMAVAVQGLEAWPEAWVTEPGGQQPPWLPDTAVLVFDREQSRFRREAALTRPLPADLALLARGLHALGVQHLLLVLPHAPGLLPQALRAGLATLDEQAVAALGFSHLVLVRPARQALGVDPTLPPGVLPRLGRAVLSQLSWMVPQREQALRPARVAQFVNQLALAVPGTPAGTRVAPAELVWDWAQPGVGDAVLQAWLHGRAKPTVVQPQPRW